MASLSALILFLGTARALGDRKPNIFLMYTDDQDYVFESAQQAMPFTTELLGTNGSRFTNFFTHTPVCCPSRSQMLSGRYFHNIRSSDPVAGKSPDCMHVNASDHFQNHLVFARALQENGYATLMAGKYMNNGGMDHICPKPVGKSTPPKLAPPRGWDRFFGMCPDTCYTDCLFVDNGVARVFNDSSFKTPGGNYAPSVIGNVTIDFIEKQLEAEKPFFVYVAPHSPHQPATPAPWYADAFPTCTAPRILGYNVSAPDHHWAVAVQPKIDAELANELDELARNRLQTLLSVDDIIREAHKVLTAAGQADNTYFIFTSDHGFHMGQLCLGPCKRQPYDSDIRIPLLFSGPGIQPNRVVSAPAGIPDLAPTILELAGVDSSDYTFDGRSMAPLLGLHDHSRDSWRDSYPIEYFATSEQPNIGGGHVKDNGNNTFRGVRYFGNGENFAYFEFTDFKSDWAFENPNVFELYDLKNDPNQTHNIVSSADPGTLQMLQKLTHTYWSCSGELCP